MRHCLLLATYLQDDVGAARSLQRPLAVGERLVLAGVAGALDDVAGGLEVVLTARRAVQLVAAVAAVVLAVADEAGVHAAPVRAVVGAVGAGVYPAHEGEERLARGQLPLLVARAAAPLDRLLHHRLDAPALAHVGVVLGPVTVVLRYLKLIQVWYYRLSTLPLQHSGRSN